MGIPCSKEKEISEIATKLELVHKVLMGNGQPGLYAQVIKLNTVVEANTETMEKLVTLVSGLSQFRTETEAEIKVKATKKVNIKWLLGLTITTVLGLLGLAVKVFTS
jgi:hypothetical protein